MTTQEIAELKDFWSRSQGKDRVFFHTRFGEYVKTLTPSTEETEEPKGTWTSSQRNAAWKYIDLKVTQLNDAGLEMRKVLKPEVSLPWTKESFHDHVWIPIQKALYGTESMRDLKKLQVSRIHEVIEREMAQNHGLDQIAFPSDPEKEKEALGGYKTAAGGAEDYPDHTPTASDEPLPER